MAMMLPGLKNIAVGQRPLGGSAFWYVFVTCECCRRTEWREVER
jgi:hypothetical protein